MTNALAEGSTAGVFLAIEVSAKVWRLALTDLKSERQVEVAAWDRGALLGELSAFKRRSGVGATARVRSCYEAGRAGFSIHRFLTELGLENVVVDSASIEVSRRGRHRKTDRLDVARLLRQLVRYHVYAERRCWQVCRVPTPEQEAARRLDREYARLKKERTSHIGRLKGLLALHGVSCRQLRELRAGQVCDWAGRLLAAPWQEEFERELERWRTVEAQVKQLEQQMAAALETPRTREEQVSARLYTLRGIGPVGATALSRQFFGWREFANRREVGAAAGLVGVPYASGERAVEQGISKAGPRRIRALAVELAWGWLRWQPDSALSRWYGERFAHGSKRLRRIGIVALARKLLVALWKYLHFGLLPQGALLRG